MFFGILPFFLLFGQLKTANSFPQPLNAEEESECLRAFADGDKKARNLLIVHNLRLVAFLSRKYSNIVNESEDLISVGTVGLIKAIQTYKPAKGHKLATYASRCIENEILMYLRVIKKYVGDVSLQEAVGTDQEGNEITLEDKLSDSCDIEEQVTTGIQVDELKVKLSILKSREREIVALRYGLDGRDELTQREIAQKLGISRSYVSRIEKKALKKLLIAF